MPDETPHSPRPLDGIRVLDFTHVLAGPFCTRVLGDLGADIVKVATNSRPATGGGPESPYYTMWNRNKRLLQLNLARPEAQQIARDLAAKADIIIDNFSVGVLDRWGLDWHSVAQTNPGVISIAMSGMGSSGPWASYVTFAPTVHALAGLTYLTGVPGRNDIGVGFSYNDHMAGLHAATALLAALEARRATGRGQRIDMSQFEVGVGFSGPALLDWFANGVAAEPIANDPPWRIAAPHNTYPCAGEDRWIAIAVETDQQWQSLRALLGDPAWARNAEFDSADGRWQRRAELDAQLTSWTARQDPYDLMQRCQQAGVPAGVVQTGEDLTQRDPQLQHANFFFRYDDPHPIFGPINGDRLPLRFSKTDAAQYHRPQIFGESNTTILSDWLSMSAEQTQSAAAEGIVE